MDIRASLAALCGSDGPSGREDQVAEVALSLLRPLVDEGYRDKFGNVIGGAARKMPNGWCWMPTWMRWAW